MATMVKRMLHSVTIHYIYLLGWGGGILCITLLLDDATGLNINKDI